nr:HD domain-containing protein [Candidatus Baldrarchaeota archaeon]
MKKRTYWGFIKDPIYGYVHITELEKELIDTRVVQRLRRLRQLAGAEYVYPGANHTRFEHSIGVMYLAGVLAESLPVNLTDEDIQMVRIAGLLHDVGHGPFSHIYESLSIKYLGKTHENLTQWIISDSELADILSNMGYSPRRISKLATGNLREEGRFFLDQIISSAVDVDKMDFIIRDSYHTGAEYGYVDIFRLIYTMDVLNGNLSVDLTALSSLEAFILARIESFKSIYFHKVARAVQIMLLKAMEFAKDEIPLVSFSNIDEYLSLDDYTVWTMLRKVEKSNEIIKKLERRQLLKAAYNRTFYVRDETVSSIFTNEKVREKIEEEIAEQANVDRENVIIDVPTLPSVPYRHSIEMEPMKIPVFYRTKEGAKVPVNLRDASQLIDALRGFMNIIRVYTWEPYREQVAKAAESIIGVPPYSAKISY